MGAVEGEVWFDSNKNGRRDANEAPLPGVQLEMTEQTGGFLRMAAVVPGPVVPARIWRTTTRADGTYRFTNVPVGSYRVVAAARVPGMVYSYDPDGLVDWISEVKVPGGKTVQADFAGVGSGAMNGQVFLETTGEGIRNAVVSCRWGGIDGVLGTSDDVTFQATADAQGKFELQDVPFGKFSCIGKDPATGKLSARSGVAVESTTPVTAKLPVALTVPARPAVVPSTPNGLVVRGRPAPELARTGAETSTLLVLATALLMLGAMTQLAGRRRRRS